MEVVTTILGSIVSVAAECTISSIRNHVKYLCSNHDHTVQSLKTQVDSLKNASQRLQHSVDDAIRNGEEIEGDVQHWLATANNKIAEQEERVRQHEEDAKRKCCAGFCPNIWARYKLGKEAEEEVKAVADLLQLQGSFDRVSFRPPPQPITDAPVKGFEAFESRTLVFNGIMKALGDATVHIIGVYGMGGVGKTTLVKEVARQVKEAKLFDSVVIATVTQSLNVENIQNQIADCVGLRFEEQSTDGRARRLRQRLKSEKKILVILDDIWERLDLEQVGIPCGDEHEGCCKILLTSRDLNVLSNGMDTQQNFEVGILKEEEAWDFFKKMAGDCVDHNDLQPIAIQVAKKCAGLPIAIATVARALKNKSLIQWKDALCELKSPASRDHREVTEAAYSAIELSYNYLRSQEYKITFLLCCLLGHNSLIEDLLRYVIGWGLFGDFNTIEEARNRVFAVVANLKASCLLLDSYENERFDIHDVVWDAAISIASRDRHMFVLREGELLKKWPEKEMMNNCSAINLRHPRVMTGLPDEMEVSHLSFFCMENDGPSIIPPNFFRGSERLKVLDLAGMQFLSLPVSTNVLTNLHTLCLKGCALEDLSIIGELTKLEILSLARSDIKALPKEMAQLTQLRSLDLSSCTKLQTIPPNVLASLSKLEELYMEDSFCEWEDEALCKERTNASLEELKHLSLLTTLYVYIPYAQLIPIDLSFETLERYCILIGGYNSWFSKPEYSRTLTFKLYKRVYKDHGVTMLSKKTEDLYLDQLEGVKNVLAELNNGESFPHLKKLHIRNGMQVQYITTEEIEVSQLRSLTLEDLPQLISFCSEETKRSTSQPEEGDMSSRQLPLFSKQFVFPHLESLQLFRINARRIWHNQISEISFYVPNLTSLSIVCCDKLEHLFSPFIARSLVQLKSLEIRQCNCLRDVIFTDGIEEEKNDVICFPQLNSLLMGNLENLIEFCSASYTIEFPLLKKLEIVGCPQLKEFVNSEENSQFGMRALFNDKVAVHCLETLTIFGLKNVKMIFDKELDAGSFCKLQELSVECCNELLTFFSSSIMGAFRSLAKLQVRRCGSVEVIFEVGAGLNLQEAHAITVVDSQLSELQIKDLPKLKQVWDRDPQGMLTFQNLRKVEVEECGSLKNVFPVSIAKDLSRLEDLSLSNCGAIEEIVSAELRDQGRMEVEVLPVSFKFPQVSSLQLTGLKELKCSYPGKHTTAWPMLKKLVTNHLSTLLKIVGVGAQAQHPGNGIQEQEAQVNGNGQPQSTIGQSVFLVEEVIPHLEELQLRLENLDDVLAIIPDGLQLPADLFGRVKVLQLMSGSFGIGIISSFLQRFFHLETLEIDKCDLKDVDPGATVVLSRIRKLRLSHSKNVKHLWKKLDWELPNLEIFEVEGCHDLINFGPSFSFSSSSFKSLTTLTVKWCTRMKNLVTASVAQNLIQLTTMKISFCDKMTEIVANEEAYNNNNNNGVIICFSKLKHIQLIGLSRLASFCPAGNYTFKFPSLQELIVRDCPHLKIFCHGVVSTPQLQLQGVKQSDFDRKGRWAGDLNTTIKQLCADANTKWAVGECDLELSDTNPDLMEIWNRNPRDFKNLQSIEFCKCSSLDKYIFTPSIALSLCQLRSLTVKECSRIEVVIMDIDQELSTYHNLLLPSNLGSIEIESCPSLTSFYLGSRSLEFPFLFRIRISECPRMSTFASSLAHGDLSIAPFFSHKVVFPILEELTIKGMNNCRKIWQDQQLSVNSFSKLKYVVVEGCDALQNIFPFNMMERLKELKDLKIVNCDSVEEIIEPLGLIANEVAHTVTTTESVTKFVFPRVRHLQLYNLHKLKSFYFRNHATEWPSLKKLEVIECRRAELFGFSEISNQQPLFRLNEVTFPILEELILEENGMFKGAWYGQVFSTECFRKLKVLELIGVPEKSTALPHSLIRSLPNLEKLVVEDASFSQIFEFEGLDDEERQALTLTQLSELSLFELPELTHLWKKEFQPLAVLCNLRILRVHECGKLSTLVPSSSVSFQNLTTLEISRCHGFINLMSCSTAKSLVLLERMTITSCEMIEEIIACGADEIQGGIVTKFVFPRVERLRLDKLPKLKSFHSGIHATEWPSLKKLEVIDCHQVQLFASESAGFGDFSNQQPLFQVNEVTFPILEELRWKPNDTFNGTSWYGQVISTEYCFRKLKVLELIGVPETSTALPYSLIQSLPNLHKLVVDDASSLFQIFEFEGLNAEETQASALTQLTELRLSKLPELTLLCRKESQSIAILSNLRILQVQECVKLTSLVLSSSVSFENLTTLEVSGCHGIVKLIACSTAKSLVLLQRMTITDCEIIEEIIACGADEIHGDIVFNRLQHLELSCLPSLVSFCLGGHNFEFPALKEVMMGGCPKMEIFCRGDLSTPKLKQVQVMEDDEEWTEDDEELSEDDEELSEDDEEWTEDDEAEGRWEGDLKTTVKQIFEEMLQPHNVQSSEVTEANLQLE